MVCVSCSCHFIWSKQAIFLITSWITCRSNGCLHFHHMCIAFGLYRIAKMLVLASVRHGNVHGVNVIYDRQALVLFSHSPIMHVQIDTISMIVDYMLSRTTTTTKAQHTMCGFSCWVYSITSIKTIK